jgi:hypothetical protein
MRSQIHLQARPASIIRHSRLQLQARPCSSAMRSRLYLQARPFNRLVRNQYLLQRLHSSNAMNTQLRSNSHTPAAPSAANT